MAAPGQPATGPDVGVEDERIWGTLTTTAEFDPRSQRLDEASGLYVWAGTPAFGGWYRGYYENVAAAIRGREDVFVRPETARDGLRVVELARASRTRRAAPFRGRNGT